MRIEGRLSKWNDERGFGFITPIQGGPDVFVHVSAFAGNDARPVPGERLSFELETDPSGKKRAIRVVQPDRPTRPAHADRMAAAPTRRREGRGLSGVWIVLLIAAAIVAGGAWQFMHRLEPRPADVAPLLAEEAAPFKCDGRTYCSEMTSCAEAKFFLKRCPNTKMDGDNDGVPCEEQWCTSPLAR